MWSAYRRDVGGRGRIGRSTEHCARSDVERSAVAWHWRRWRHALPVDVDFVVWTRRFQRCWRAHVPRLRHHQRDDEQTKHNGVWRQRQDRTSEDSARQRRPPARDSHHQQSRRAETASLPTQIRRWDYGKIFYITLHIFNVA